MPLTPEDVHAKQFTVAGRMKSGYDMDEVDTFLDEIEVELARLVAENDDLRARLSRAQAAALEAERRATAAGASKVDAPTAVVSLPDDTSPSIPIVTDVPPVIVETPAPAPVPSVSAEAASAQALTILEMAQRTADQTLAEAQEEADRIVSKANVDAANVATERRAEVIQLERRIGELKSLEQGYRSEMRSFITSQLAQLDERPPIVADLPTEGASEVPDAVEPDRVPGWEADRFPGWDS